MIWAIAYFFGLALLPFVTIGLQRAAGSCVMSSLCIPVLVGPISGRWPRVREHAGEVLDYFAV